MLNPKLNLSNKIFKKDLEKVSTRDGFGEGLVIAGEDDDRIVVLTADLTDSTRVKGFKERFPSRFIQVGVAEQALVTIASGMAAYGKIPFATSFAIFSPGRNWEQIRTTIALNDVPVKIVGSHAGLSAGLDGGNHQMLEDIALMRVLPNMVVLVPIDAIETRRVVLEAVKNGKPTYIRVQRDPTPVITSEDTPFKIGKAEVLWETKNPQVAIIGCGPILYEALVAARDLGRKGIDCLVINSHTVKPLDEQAIVHAAKITGAIVTVEEHQKAGGLGGAVSEVLARNFPVPIELVGMSDKFGESGKPNDLLEKFKMTSQDIANAAKRAINRKEF
jgi:transketolase